MLVCSTSSGGGVDRIVDGGGGGGVGDEGLWSFGGEWGGTGIICCLRQSCRQHEHLQVSVVIEVETNDSKATAVSHVCVAKLDEAGLVCVCCFPHPNVRTPMCTYAHQIKACLCAGVVLDTDGCSSKQKPDFVLVFLTRKIRSSSEIKPLLHKSDESPTTVAAPQSCKIR